MLNTQIVTDIPKQYGTNSHFLSNKLTKSSQRKYIFRVISENTARIKNTKTLSNDYV
jgi:hypothetical protein